MRAAAAVLALALTACSTSTPGEQPISAAPSSVVATHHSRWETVLSGLDRLRSRAYDTGRPRLLHAVYVPGATPLATDRAMLRAYGRKGVDLDRVDFALEQVELRRRGHDWVLLRVVDRLRLIQARVDGRLIALPRDRATEWRVVLRQVSGTWRIARLERLAG